jgi:uracil-DNA glycosylase family 4
MNPEIAEGADVDTAAETGTGMAPRALGAATGMMGAPRINALQKLWLREIGIEKTWTPVAEAPAVPGSGKAGQPLAGQAATLTGGAERGASPKGGTGRGPSPLARADASGSGPARSGSVAASGSAPDTATDTAADTAADTAPASRSSAVKPARPTVPVPAPGSVASAERLAEATSSIAEAAAGAPDLDALRAQVEVCTACQLCQGRRHAVFGMGAQPARWMVIGEAPGEQEDRQGQPFVGRSGQLLDSMLRAVGMSRDENVFIANVIKCRPPGNRNPKPEEIAACSPYLKRQIELVQPERILVLGRFAAQTLLGTDATIGSLRGRQHVWTTEAGVRIPVIVSYHPAYLLRSPLEKARAWQDLQLAIAASV